jgi:hypothetical protein
MTALGTRSTTLLAATALSLVITPAFARGGGGGRGGGHVGGGHVGGGHVSAPHYSAPHYSAPHSYGGGIGGGASPMRGPVVGYGHGYIGGGRGAYLPGGRVPAFYGGPRRGGVWWGPRYGWHVPVYWGGYYRPYPAYWGVGYWVTDWIMLDYLAAEEARMLAYGGPPVAVPAESMPLDVGAREELRAQIAEYLAMPAPPAGAAAPAPGNMLVVNDPRVARALAAPHHVFVVSQPVSVMDRTTGGTCNLTPADLVRSGAPIPSGHSTADVLVAASKQSSCPAGATVALPVADLVHFEEALLVRVARGSAAAQAADTQAEPAPSAPGATDVPSAGAAPGPQP